MTLNTLERLDQYKTILTIHIPHAYWLLISDLKLTLYYRCLHSLSLHSWKRALCQRPHFQPEHEYLERTEKCNEFEFKDALIRLKRFVSLFALMARHKLTYIKPDHVLHHEKKTSLASMEEHLTVCTKEPHDQCNWCTYVTKTWYSITNNCSFFSKSYIYLG